MTCGELEAHTAGDLISMIVADTNDRKIGPATAMAKIQAILDDMASDVAAAERDRIRQLAEHHGVTYRTTDDADPSPFAQEFAGLLAGDPK